MTLETSIIYCGDCLIKLNEIPNDSVDLIYIDPPFSSNRNYVAFWEEQEKRHFEDRFENVQAYIDYMRPRVKELYRVLKPTGSFYYHCDWHASHHIKVMLDRDDLFGYNSFRNEIIWCYTRPSPKHRQFPRTHDTILFYTKGKQYTFEPDRVRIPYNPESLARSNRVAGVQSVMGTKGRDRLHSEGKLPESWWTIPIIQGNANERLGYPTQKPAALLERIVKVSSNEGDIVLVYCLVNDFTICRLVEDSLNRANAIVNPIARHMTRCFLWLRYNYRSGSNT